MDILLAFTEFFSGFDVLNTRWTCFQMLVFSFLSFTSHLPIYLQSFSQHLPSTYIIFFADYWSKYNIPECYSTHLKHCSCHLTILQSVFTEISVTVLSWFCLFLWDFHSCLLVRVCVCYNILYSRANFVKSSGAVWWNHMSSHACSSAT